MQSPGVGVVEAGVELVQGVGESHRESALLIGSMTALAGIILPGQRAFLIIWGTSIPYRNGGLTLTEVPRVMDAEPFFVHVPDAVLDDLRSRLRHTRWPEPLPYPGWTAGADLDYLKELVGYWASSFDWRAQERWLNSFPQFTADVDGQVIHFVHQRGQGPSPFPLVLTHGWPSSFVELLKLPPCSPTRPPTAATNGTASTWSFPRCPATRSHHLRGGPGPAPHAPGPTCGPD